MASCGCATSSWGHEHRAPTGGLPLRRLAPSAHDHDLIAHALNERFTELGGDHPVPYVEDENDN